MALHYPAPAKTLAFLTEGEFGVVALIATVASLYLLQKANAVPPPGPDKIGWWPMWMRTQGESPGLSPRGQS